MYLKLLKNAWLHLYIRILRFIGIFYNPLVTKQIGSVRIKLPFAHELPIYLKLFPLYSANLPRLVKIHAIYKNKLNIIDVGANVGDTVALLADGADFNILCVEGDDKYYEILKKNTENIKNISLSKSFLGEKRESLHVQIDGARGTGQLIESDTTLQIETLDNLLTQFSNFSPVDVVKIDTDGFDNAIIRGAKNLISKDTPLLFFEWMPDVLKEKEIPEDIFKFLYSLGYFRALVYDNLGFLIGDVDIADVSSISAMLARFYGHGVSKYADIAVFHKSKEKQYFECSKREIEFFKNLKKA